MTGVLWGFETEYRVESGKNYLVLSREGLERDDILGFQVEMIANNRIPGIVPVRLRERNAELEIYYDLTGLASLKNYLKRQHISKTEFVRLLEGMVSIISDGCRYYLDNSSFVFCEDFVYLNPVSKEVFLLYLPAGIQQDAGQSFKTMVVNTLISSANIDTADNFVQKLLKLFNNGEFDPTEFCRRLKSIDMNDCGNMEQPNGTACLAGEAGEGRLAGIPGQVCLAGKFRKGRASATAATAATGAGGAGIGGAGTAGVRRAGTAGSTASGTGVSGASGASGVSGAGVSCELQPLGAVRRERKNTRTKVLAAMAVIAVSGAVLSNIYDRWGGLGDISAGTLLAGYLPAVASLLLAAGGAAAWLAVSRKKAGRQPKEEAISQHAGLKRFVAEIDTPNAHAAQDVHAAPDMHAASNMPATPNMPVTPSMSAAQNMPAASNMPATPNMPVTPSMSAAQNMLAAPNKPLAPNMPVTSNMPAPQDMTGAADMAEETVLLGETNFPFLMAVNGDETIVINKPEFIIGRNESACDYAIRDRSIGRTHARIKTVDNVFYILDLDSKNGTSINNTRIMSSQQYELKHNDRVAFANVEYCFRVK